METTGLAGKAPAVWPVRLCGQKPGYGTLQGRLRRLGKLLKAAGWWGRIDKVCENPEFSLRLKSILVLVEILVPQMDLTRSDKAIALIGPNSPVKVGGDQQPEGSVAQSLTIGHSLGEHRC